jgi:hypothetical protein
MIEARKFYLKQYRLYLDKKYGDSEKVPYDKFCEEFIRWTEENEEELLKEYEEYCEQFIYKKGD